MSSVSLNKIKTYNDNYILTEGSENRFIDDYLNLIRCTEPYCNCGKCISKNVRDKREISNFNYRKNIESTYKNQFNWKPPEKYISSYNNEKNNNKSLLDNCFKEHLKSGFQSIMKSDFKNVQTEPNEKIIPKDNLDNNSSPFIGRSVNSIMYPNWMISLSTKKPEIPEAFLNIPFTGESSYKQNFERFDNRYYRERQSPILKKDNLEVNGRLNTQTTSKETYKPIDFSKSKELGFLNKDKNFSNLSSSAPYSKDSFLSSYERAFMFNNLTGKNQQKNIFKIENDSSTMINSRKYDSNLKTNK